MAEPETLADVSDLADWIGEPIAAGTVDEKRALLCLRLASSLVRVEVGRDWLTETGVLDGAVPDAARMVTLYCASRVYENREAQTRGSIDDFDQGWKVDEAGAYLTASERRMLSGLKRSTTGGLYTVATTRGERHAPGVWVPTDTPNVYFPWA
ncbi:hypothetical protein [Agrococcus sp. DT81.2]|uniref:hypothetical protein n=1 Tax=Agrococcus sp. DT81.2 TaxID=3393414 RepID=UPI003CE50A31